MDGIAVIQARNNEEETPKDRIHSAERVPEEYFHQASQILPLKAEEIAMRILYHNRQNIVPFNSIMGDLNGSRIDSRTAASLLSSLLKARR